ncbi:hypothetical protein EI555_011271, partial [Monodon monoceros]
AIGTNARLLGGGSEKAPKNVSAKYENESRGKEDGNNSLISDWFLRAPERKLMTVPRLPKKPCPCDHFKGRVKKTSKLQKNDLP